MRSLFLLLYIITALSASSQSLKVSKWPRGITYEIFVQSFADSDGNGIGDIKGMTSRLDYLKDLGVEGIWLMPMSPSPSYHKYDVTDYYGIHPDYGTLDDFREFTRQAHARNIHVVIDLVINHSSREHPWFKEASTNINAPSWDYYVWTKRDDPQTMAEATRLNEDSGNRRRWRRAADSVHMYYSYFGPHMPDLNFDSPKLRDEIFKMGQYWLKDIGVDGFRLDAARHIFPDERASDNHWWWRYFRSEMQKAKQDVYLVGEVWAPAEIVAPYTNGIPALFNFDLSGWIKSATLNERGDSVAIRLKKVLDTYKKFNPDFVDATFLSNHDQNRVMSFLGDDMNKARMAAAMLFTLPGSPYIYYGEEIGMKGRKPDPNIREPMLWDKQSNDKQRAKWITPRYTNDTTVSPVSLQLGDKNSLLNYYKTFIALRNKSNVLTYGDIAPVDLGLKEVSAFVRSHENESLLVIHNVSKSSLNVSLPQELSAYSNTVFTTKKAAIKNGNIGMEPYSTLILKK